MCIISRCEGAYERDVYEPKGLDGKTPPLGGSMLTFTAGTSQDGRGLERIEDSVSEGPWLLCRWTCRGGG